MTYVYDGKFSGNILVVGRTGCGKTAFVQKLAINRFFGELNAAEWVSFIKLDKAREAEIQSYFECELDFYYPRNKEQFEELLEYFKTKSNSLEIENNMNNDNINDINDLNITNYGEKSIRSRFIVMDDVSGLADLFTKFDNFLTVARKFGYQCLYIFHAIHPEKAIWRTILSQTNLLNIFPGSVPLSTVKKVLEANCIRNSNKYIPVNSLWVTKLSIRLANEDSEKTCLTIDCSGFNPNGPGRFRTDASNPLTQACFFNKADQDFLLNIFISKRIQNKSADKVLFEIEGLKTSTDNATYNPSLELENLQRNGLSNVRNDTDEQDGRGFEQSKFRPKWKSVRPKFLRGR